ncbi:hypothetical protein IP68_12165 [Blastomonas sp. AAP25]|nr:hypothetical protein IP68_12165 [Blastomonas sp. AAP25]
MGQPIAAAFGTVMQFRNSGHRMRVASGRTRRIPTRHIEGAILMRTFAIVSLAALALGVSACSAETENKTDAAAEAAGDDIEANVDAAGEAIDDTMDDVEASVDQAAKDLDAEADKAGDKIEKEWDDAKAEVRKETD